MKKLFAYNLEGYVEIVAESQEEADSELWDMNLMDANIDVDACTVEEVEDKEQ